MNVGQINFAQPGPQAAAPVSPVWWVAIGLAIVALAWEGGRREGPWMVILIVLSLLFIAKAKGQI